MNALYKAIGISKQAVHQYAKRQDVFDQKVTELVKEAELIRKEHPGCGVEKMYYTLQPDFIGRDRFVELLMDLGFRLRRKKNYRRTTYSSKVYYPNLIKGKEVDGPSQIWQSDITYIPLGQRFYYAVFIIDVYTKEIVGYNVSNSLRAEANIKALKMALKKHKPPCIHHSDRGTQYTCNEYIELLSEHGVEISMCDSALDNAYAERINQTIKKEYLEHWYYATYAQLRKMVSKAVRHYNNKRIHDHLNRTTPKDFENTVISLSKDQRPTMSIFDYDAYLALQKDGEGPENRTKKHNDTAA